jgi:hypothetical protein
VRVRVPPSVRSTWVIAPTSCRSGPTGRGVRFRTGRFRVRIPGAARARRSQPRAGDGTGPENRVRRSTSRGSSILRIDLGPFDYGLGSGVLNSGERVRVPQGLREAQWGSSAVPVSFIR